MGENEDWATDEKFYIKRAIQIIFNCPPHIAKACVAFIRRLAESVDHMNLQYEKMQLEIERLTQTNQQLQAQVAGLTSKHEQTQLTAERLRTVVSEVLGLFQKLQQTAGSDPELRRQFLEAIPKLIVFRAKELKVDPAAPDNYNLANYWQHGVLPEPLFLAATKRAAPKS